MTRSRVGERIEPASIARRRRRCRHRRPYRRKIRGVPRGPDSDECVCTSSGRSTGMSHGRTRGRVSCRGLKRRYKQHGGSRYASNKVQPEEFTSRTHTRPLAFSPRWKLVPFVPDRHGKENVRDLINGISAEIWTSRKIPAARILFKLTGNFVSW